MLPGVLALAWTGLAEGHVPKVAAPFRPLPVDFDVETFLDFFI
jgi:hypothetical protein